MQIPKPIIYSGIILGNILPLYGVLFLDWSLFDIFYLYWAENVLIGVATIIRILIAGAAFGLGSLFGSLFLIGFFTFHYGLFCMVHGSIMFEMFYDGQIDVMDNPLMLIEYAFSSSQAAFLPALAGLCFAVLLDTLHRLYKDRIEGRLPPAIMFTPYGRIVVLHLTILLGGLLAMSLGSPLWALAFLVVLKILYELAVIRDKNVFNLDKAQTTIKENP